MTQLDAIEHLVLLDLLGAENPIVQSYYSSTAWLFDGLVAAEHRLGLLGLFNEAPASNAEGGEWHTWSSFFKPRTSFDHMWGGIQDDHVPFVKRGVNILHVIANPFPRVWHSLKVRVYEAKRATRLTVIVQDDASAIHIPTLKRWNLIFRIFTVEYLKLKPSSITSQKRAVGDELVMFHEHTALLIANRNVSSPGPFHWSDLGSITPYRIYLSTFLHSIVSVVSVPRSPLK